eukprot:9249312-Lingulodinium_polyedra.AAC.1
MRGARFDLSDVSSNGPVYAQVEPVGHARVMARSRSYAPRTPPSQATIVCTADPVMWVGPMYFWTMCSVVEAVAIAVAGSPPPTFWRLLCTPRPSFCLRRGNKFGKRRAG